MNQRILSNGKLLNSYGNLDEAGYAKSLVKEYRRDDIKASSWRIKEWDYYYIGCSDFGIALTIDDNSYMGLGSVSLLDFKNKTFITKSVIKWFTFGRTKLPATSKVGDVSFRSKKLSIDFINNGVKRVIK